MQAFLKICSLFVLGVPFGFFVDPTDYPYVIIILSLLGLTVVYLLFCTIIDTIL